MSASESQKSQDHPVITIQLRKSSDEREMMQRRKEFFKQMRELQQTPFKLKLDEMLVAMSSERLEFRTTGIRWTRQVLCQQNPPINMMMDCGIVPKCVRFLESGNSPEVQYEAAWALTNIASGNKRQTRCVIEFGAVPKLIALLQSKAENVAEQATWALSNIAGDGENLRDLVYKGGVVDSILALINSEISLSFERQIAMLLMNLCRNKYPPPKFAEVQRLLPVLWQLLGKSDVQVISFACWAVFYVTDGNADSIQAVIDSDAVSRLVNLLDMPEESVLIPALRCVGNIVSGTDEQTNVVIVSGALPKLVLLLQHQESHIVQLAAWVVSNIAAGTESQIEALFETGAIFELRRLLEMGDSKVQRETAWAVSNAIVSGTTAQAAVLVKTYRILRSYTRLVDETLFDKPDPTTTYVILTGLETLFNNAEESDNLKPFCRIFKQIRCLMKLEPLLKHENKIISKKAANIIDKYFKPAVEAGEPIGQP